MTNPDQVLLTREQLLQRLNGRGFPIKASYFNKLCLPSRNAGPPPAVWYGKRPLYRLEDALLWAESKCSTSRAGVAA
jgi:hypothetical protein